MEVALVVGIIVLAGLAIYIFRDKDKGSSGGPSRKGGKGVDGDGMEP